MDDIPAAKEPRDGRAPQPTARGKRPFFRGLWHRWLTFSAWCLRVNTAILMTLIYFVVVPLALFIRIRDPLRMHRADGSSWEKRSAKVPPLRRLIYRF